MNFLTRLAQRNLGVANLVHPRLPSTFESVNESADTRGVIKEMPLASTSENLPSLVLSSPSNAYNAENTHTPARTSRSKDERARGSTREAIDIAAHRDHAVASTPAHPPLFTQPFTSAPEEGGPPHAEGRYRRVLSIHPEDGRGADAAPSPPLVASRQDPQTAAHTPSQPRFDALVAAHAGQIDRRGAFEPASVSPIEAKTIAPTVHISIGRVEVRAHVAAPPQAPRPRADRPPTRSLADYLTRGGGKP